MFVERVELVALHHQQQRQVKLPMQEQVLQVALEGHYLLLHIKFIYLFYFITSIPKVKVTFRDEPGEGTGVARHFYAAVAEVDFNIFNFLILSLRP